VAAVARDRRLETAISRLDKLIAWAEEHDEDMQRNEAATRLHLIDELLMQVLGWPRDQVSPEEHSPAGYADYVLGRPQRRLVVEAKREGLAFHLPPETSTETTLPTLFRLDPKLQKVVQQARSYASEFGLEYGAVCNGGQLVVFLATRTDGIEPLKGRALAFPSLSAMRDNFALLWDGLSRPGTEARRLSVLLGREGVAAPPPKASSYISG